jgi:RNA polymerase sigma-70 factor (ECF subfamily)
MSVGSDGEWFLSVTAGREAERELVLRAREGDTQAFSALCEAERRRVWRITSSVARGAEAEDLAQEAIVRAFRAFHTYAGEASFGAWLTRITVNIAHDHLRSAWRRRVTLREWLPADRETTCPTGEAELRDLQRHVRAAVARLPEPQRTPIWLHYFEGYSLAEVSRLEQVPEPTIRSRVKAGQRKLARALRDHLPPEEITPRDSEAKWKPV